MHILELILFLPLSSLVTLAQRGLSATGPPSDLNTRGVNVLGRRAIYPNERARWEFEVSNTTFMIGLARVRDSALFFPDSCVKVTFPCYCGWYYHVECCSQYWSNVNPYSAYMGERYSDSCHRQRKLEGDFTLSLNGTDRVIMELIGSTLTLALSGTSSYLPEFERFTEVDRSEPLCLAAFLRGGSTVIISKCEVRLERNTVNNENDKK